MGMERFWRWMVWDGREWKRFDIKDLEGAFLHACTWMYGGKLEDGWQFKDPLPDRSVEIDLELVTNGCNYYNRMELDFSLHDEEHMFHWDPEWRTIAIPGYIKDRIRHVRRKYMGGE